MARLLAIARLCRLSNLPTIWTNVVAGAILSGFSDIGGIVVLALSMSLFYAGGMALNDLADIDEDRVAKPHRPLPSGDVGRGEAAAVAGSLFTGGMAFLALTPHPRAGLACGVLLVAAIVAYDLLHRRSPLTVLLMALCRGLVFVTTAQATTATLPLPAALAAAAQFLYVLAIAGTARYEKKHSFSFPIIPAMIAGISILDGILISIWNAAAWLAAGALGALLTLSGQKTIPGD